MCPFTKSKGSRTTKKMPIVSHGKTTFKDSDKGLDFFIWMCLKIGYVTVPESTGFITISIHFAYENGQFAAFLSAVGRCFPTTTKPSTISKALSRAAMRSHGMLCQGRHSNRPNSQNAWLEVAKFTTKLDYEFTINQQKWGFFALGYSLGRWGYGRNIKRHSNIGGEMFLRISATPKMELQLVAETGQ